MTLTRMDMFQLGRSFPLETAETYSEDSDVFADKDKIASNLYIGDLEVWKQTCMFLHS